MRNVDDFYAAIGYGGISVIRLMPYIKEEYNKKLPFSGDRIVRGR